MLSKLKKVSFLLAKLQYGQHLWGHLSIFVTGFPHSYLKHTGISPTIKTNIATRSGGWGVKFHSNNRWIFQWIPLFYCYQWIIKCKEHSRYNYFWPWLYRVKYISQFFFPQNSKNIPPNPKNGFVEFHNIFLPWWLWSIQWIFGNFHQFQIG